MSSKLLSYYQSNPPDLEKRAYYKSLGLKTSDAEVGDPTSGRMLTIPPPPRGSIVQEGGDRTEWLSKGSMQEEIANKSGTTGSAAYADTVSFVSPVLWVPGVLRKQGTWATVMRETAEGVSFALTPGVDLIKEDDDSLPGYVPKVSAEDQLLENQRLIQELERTVSKQRILNEKLAMKSKLQAFQFNKRIQVARRKERARHDKEVQEKIVPLKEKITDLKDDLRTTVKANRVRVKRAYAQDNFNSQYNKALLTVKDLAQEISDKQQSSLRNDLSTLERRLARETQYKLALKQRTETAEAAAERRWNEAERKIPVLEQAILSSKIQLEQNMLMHDDLMNKRKKDIERLKGDLKKEVQEKSKFSSEAEDLKKRLAEAEFRMRQAEKVAARAEKASLSSTFPAVGAKKVDLGASLPRR